MKNTSDINKLRQETFGMLNYREGTSIPHKHARRTEGQSLAQYFDHTILKNTAGKKDILALCREAVEWQMKAVCLPPNRVALAHSVLKNSEIQVCTVVGFPLGYDSSVDKARQCERVIHDGAGEVDMVISVSELKEGNYVAVFKDIKAVVESAGSVLVKVILETCLLSDEEIIRASAIAVAAGASMLKTSTGFSTAGATLHDIALMRQVGGEAIGVKASGGIRSLEFAQACIQAGADRIGASSTVAILSEAGTEE